jgi:hypothetical protein
MAAKIAAIREQGRIKDRYRTMFGLDIATRPTIPADQAIAEMWADINRRRAELAANPALPAPTWTAEVIDGEIVT